MIASRKVAPLLLLLILSCKTKPAADPREDLQNALKGADVNGYTFQLTEDESRSTATFTNPALREPLKLDKKNPQAILRYTRVVDKKSGTARTYRTEIAPSGTTIALRVTDMASNEVILNKTPTEAPRLGATCNVSSQIFPSIPACLSEFNCSCRPALQCEANRTCETQFVFIKCCRPDNQCVDIHLFVAPNSIKCQITGFLPDSEGLLLSQ
jgi:hypothetical protein